MNAPVNNNRGQNFMTIPEPLNMDYIDSQHALWQSDPDKVSREWRLFFEGFKIGAEGEAAAREAPRAGAGDLIQSRAEALIRRYRDLGHLLACTDPLSACPTDHPLLNLSAFDLDENDLDQTVRTRSLPDLDDAPLKDILKLLRETYCRSIGVEYMHLQDPDERRWLQERMEPNRNRPELSGDDKKRILKKLAQSALFEGFLNKKYIAQTRFSLEGADALIPLLDFMFRLAAEKGCREIILGMAHRGRLNVQTNLLERSFEDIFAQFEHCYDPDNVAGAGDVKYHNGYLTDIEADEGRTLQAYLVDNPSHLESVDPVAEGVARAREDLLETEEGYRVLPVLLHGDAAFAGQGVVAETLNLSQLAGYRTGGTVHVVINNQIGYTTLPEDARSTRYATDVAKMLMAPIFHVHGENPEAVVHVARLAAEYRREFQKDVVIDLICYRRYGHNEGDEPYFTQPGMYSRIKERPPVHQLYSDRLTEAGVVESAEIDEMEKKINSALDEAFDTIKNSACAFPTSDFYPEWEDFTGTYSHEPVDTAVDKDRLVSIAEKLNTPPKDFTPHSKLKKLLKNRMTAVEEGEGIDWGNAEALAFGSLLTEKIPIRLSGQDVRRGTFSHRHSVMTDQETEDHYTPLNNLSDDQARFMVYDSLLAESSVLGFEYGYSLVRPHALTIWEAQFGDFSNNAQAIIDLYIASGQAKWQRLSGLTLLLPHGMEGLGPEHSSARPERFLQLCSNNNMQVCNPTTPAQIFHLLRRQAKATWRIPLIVLSPKSLLRHPQAVSTLGDLTEGEFQTVLDDPAKPESPRRAMICSGKLYYELAQRREDLKARDIVILRVEQIYPFPRGRLERLVNQYPTVDQWCWVQEEAANMGAWSFIGPRLEILLDGPIRYIGRKTSSSPATGYPQVYRREQAAIIEEAIGPPADQLKESDRYQGG